jgi:hypothetical protein
MRDDISFRNLLYVTAGERYRALFAIPEALISTFGRKPENLTDIYVLFLSTSIQIPGY